MFGIVENGVRSFFFRLRCLLDLISFEILSFTAFRKDICLECVGKKKAELEFMALVDAKTKTARLLLREKTQRFFNFHVMYFIC